MLFPLSLSVVRNLRHLQSPASSPAKASVTQPAPRSQGLRRGFVAAVCMLLLTACMLSPTAHAQISFVGAQNTLLSNPAGSNQSPVAVDSNGDAFVVVSNASSTALWEIPANGTPFAINSSFSTVPSAIAVDPAGTTLYFIYYGTGTNCSGGSVFIATAPVSTGVATKMPCSFTFMDGTTPFTVSFTSPSSLAVDPSGNLWIVDQGGGDFFEIPAPVTPTSVPTMYAPLASGEPADIAVNGDGKVYFTLLAFHNSSDIQEVAEIPTSSFTNNLGGSPVTPTALVTNVPSIQSGLAVDSSGHIFLGGSSTDSEIIGSSLLTVDSDFVDGTQGLATDSNGNLYIDGADETGTQNVVELNKKAASFGSQPIEQTSTAKTLSFIITNTTIGSIGVLTAGAPNLDFASASGTTCTAKAYTSATACVVNVTFTPNAPGLRAGALVFYSGANSTGTILATVPLYGTGVGAQIGYFPGTVLAIDPTVNALQLKYPGAVAIDGQGDLYIADFGNNRVVKVPAGNGTPTAIDPSVNGKSLNAPYAVAVDGAGNLFISDYNNNRVVEVAADGTPSAIDPVVNGLGLSGPYAVAVDGAGNLFVADEYNNRIVEVPSGGGTPTAIDPIVNGNAVSYPTALAVDAAGDLFIGDYGNSRVVKVPPGGAAPTAIAPAPNGKKLDGVVGVAVDAAGDLYISNFFTSSIVEVPGDGSAPTTINTLVDGTSVFGPEGVAVDAAGNLFIADYETWRIVEVQHSVAPTLNFPTPTLVGSTDTADGPQTVQIVNIGNSALTFLNVDPIANPNYPLDFPENTGQSNLCTDVSYPPDASCYISAEFTPLSPGTSHDDIELTYNLFGSIYAVDVIPLTGANNQQAQTINFTPPTSPVNLGVSPITLVATGGASGNPVVFSVLSGPGTVSGVNGSTLTITNTGTVVVAANQAGNNNYTAAFRVTQSIVVNPPVAATLTSPAPGLGTVLGSSNVTFQWTTIAAATQYQLNLSAVAAGASDLYSYKGTATTATAPTIPANGVKVYATLYTRSNGVWVSNSYLYTESGTPTPAALTSPTPGLTTILGTTNVAFHWTAGIDVTGYQLNLSAIAAGASDLYLYKGTALTATAATLPANGVKVYATLYSKINGVWQSNSYLFTETGTPTPAALTSPTPGIGTTLGTSNVTFQWTSGIDVADYQLNLSAIAAGGSDLYTYKGTAHTATAPTLPGNGTKLYARLYSYINGAWQHNDYVYTEGGTPTPATLTSPTPGLSTILGTSNVTFQWTAGIAVADYQLNLSAKSPGASDLYTYKGTAQTTTAPTLPANGVKVYARLYSYINGAWQYNDYVYTEQ